MTEHLSLGQKDCPNSRARNIDEDGLVRVGDSAVFQQLVGQTTRLVQRVVDSPERSETCRSCRDTGFNEKVLETPIGQLVFVYKCEATIKTQSATVAYCEAASRIDSGYYPTPDDPKKPQGDKGGAFGSDSYKAPNRKVTMPGAKPIEKEAEMLKLSQTLPTEQETDAWMSKAVTLIELEFTKTQTSRKVLVSDEHAEVVIKRLQEASQDPGEDVAKVLDELMEQIETMED